MAGAYKGTLEALLATVIDGEQGALNVNVVAQGAQPTPMGAYKGTPEALLATVVDGEMGAINVNVIKGGGGITVILATWSPADVTQDETATLLTIPAGAVTIVFAAKRATPTDAGSSPYFGLDDGLPGGHGLKVSGLALASDSNSLFFADGSSSIGPQFNTFTYLSNYYNADTPLVLAYTAGLTPGATVPVVEFCLAVIPGVFA